MIPTLQNNKAFIADYAKYQNKISLITDESLKFELTKLLEDLKKQVGYIDLGHQQMFVSGRISTEISEIRSVIISIKKTLDEKISFWERSKYIVKPAPLPNEE